MPEVQREGRREIEEMKKYQTWEVVKSYHEGKLTVGQEFKTDANLDTLIVGEKGLRWKDTDTDFTIQNGRGYYEWELIQQPVPFLEAVKAYSEGKTIRSERANGFNYRYKKNDGDYFKDTSGDAPSTSEILEGTWYIVED